MGRSIAQWIEYANQLRRRLAVVEAQKAELVEALRRETEAERYAKMVCGLEVGP